MRERIHLQCWTRMSLKERNGSREMASLRLGLARISPPWEEILLRGVYHPNVDRYPLFSWMIGVLDPMSTSFSHFVASGGPLGPLGRRRAGADGE